MTVEPSSALPTIAAVAAACADDSPCVKVRANGALSLSARSAGNESRADIAGATLQRVGREDAFGINPEYLAGALQAFGGEPVSIGWNEPTAPILFRSATDASARTVVVMPVTID